MAANDMIDSILSQTAIDQYKLLKDLTKIATDDMVKLSQAARAAVDSLGDTKTLATYVEQSKAASEANKGVVNTTKLLTDAIKLNTDIIAKNNGHSLEFTKNLKNVAVAQKTATQEAILLAERQDKVTAAQQKAAASAQKQTESYAQLNKQYTEARNSFRNLAAEFEKAQESGTGWTEAQVRALTEAEAKAAQLRATLKDINARIGDNTMNVGNYPQNMAEYRQMVAAQNVSGQNSGFMTGMTTSAASAGQILSNVNQQMERMVILGQQDSEEFERLAAFAAELKAEIQSVALAVAEIGEKAKMSTLALEKIGETMKEIGKFAIAFFGFQAGMEFLSGISEEFGKANEASRQLGNTLDNLGNKQAIVRINEEVEKLTKQFKYLDDYEVQGVFDKLLTYGKLTEGQINELIPVIINFSAKQKLSVEAGSDVFTKALEGNSKVLKQYGIDIKDAAVGNQTAAGTTERLNLIMKELKPRVEGAAAAFGESFSGKVAGIKKTFREVELAIADFFVTLSGVETQQFNNAVAAKKEAEQAQKLIDEYETLSGKVNQTTEEKARLNEITTTLGATFGNSVVKINEETGAIEVNIDATKELIKQKLLLADQKAAEIANQYNTADEKRAEAVENAAKAQLLYEAAVKRTGITIEEIRSRTAYSKSGAILDNLTPDEKQVRTLHDNVVNYQNEVTKYLNLKIQAADKLRELGFSEDDVQKLFNPNQAIVTKPPTDPKTPKTHDKGEDYKAEQELTRELYSEYAKRLQIAAEAQKAISDDEKKSLNERLTAFQQYSELTFKAQAEDLSAQYDNIDGSLKQIEKIEKKSTDKREQWEKDLVARKAVLLQQRNNISAQYDLLEQQHIDKTAQGIVKIQQDEINKRLAYMKTFTDQVDLEEGEALKNLSQSLEKGTISYKDYTEQKKEIEENFQKTKQMYIKTYLQDEIAALQKQGVDVTKLQEALNQALKALYGVDAKNAEDAGKKKAEGQKMLNDKIWEAVGAGIDNAKSMVDSYYQNQLQHEDELLTAIETRKQAETDAINNSMMSDKQKQTAIMALNAEVAVQERQIAEEKKKLQRQQAIADRVAAILRVAENTAIAITGIWATEGIAVPLATTLTAIVAGIGAVETAAILAAPMPQYGEGTEDHPGGRALIGELYKPELVREPGKAPYIVDRPMVRDLARHTEVIPLSDRIAASFGFMTPSLFTMHKMSNDFTALQGTVKEEIGALKEAVINKREMHFHWNNGQLVLSQKRGNSLITYLNSNFA